MDEETKKRHGRNYNTYCASCAMAGIEPVTFERFITDERDEPAEVCGHVGTDRYRSVTVRCTLPKGHSGKHGGGGCEWNDAAMA